MTGFTVVCVICVKCVEFDVHSVYSFDQAKQAYNTAKQQAKQAPNRKSEEELTGDNRRRRTLLKVLNAQQQPPTSPYICGPTYTPNHNFADHMALHATKADRGAVGNDNGRFVMH